MIPQNYAWTAKAIWNAYLRNTMRLIDSTAHHFTLVCRLPDRSVDVHIESTAVRNPDIDEAIKRVALPSSYDRTLMELAEIREGQARFLEKNAYVREQTERRDEIRRDKT